MFATSCGAPAVPGSDYTWADGASQFFEAHCVRCHDASHSGGDYSRYEDVREDAVAMRCGLAVDELDGCEPPLPDPMSFPTGPRPPEDEVDQVLEWIEDGLPR